MNKETDESNELLRVSDLRVYFDTGRKSDSGERERVRAVEGVSFSLARGETLGLVGESGCGKSTTARALVGLNEPTGGEAWLNIAEPGRPAEWVDLLKGIRRRRSLRRHVQYVFQDPFASLNPRMTVGDIISEPIRLFGLHPRRERAKRTQELMDEVGLDPRYVKRYPHEFSGGQRQRIGIARALALDPSLIICDEPVSALDVSIQSQVLNLLADLQKQRGLAYIFIAHDLAVVKRVSRRVAVMYLGRIVETADRDELYRRPLHPYTQALLSAVPVPDPALESARERILLTGDPPSPTRPYLGCPFAGRCFKRMEHCDHVPPRLAVADEAVADEAVADEAVASGNEVAKADGHGVACLLYPSSVPEEATAAV